MAHEVQGGTSTRMVQLGRGVVLLVLGAVVALVSLIAAIASFTLGTDDPSVPVEITIGSWDTLVQFVRPAWDLVLAAVFAMVFVAAGALAFEGAALMRTFRNPERQALQPTLPDWTRPSERGRAAVRITILVPAHDEAASLPITLAALAQQSRQPDRVVVVADNCSDATADVAREFGHEVFETAGNTHKKGGALNQALASILPGMGPDDAVMVMDADTSLGPLYLETAADLLDDDPDLEAIGGVFFGEPGHGVIGIFQRNEYRRYSQEISRRRGRVFVLTGTASVFRASALTLVAAARGRFIPGEPGLVYDTAALTEDNELTISLKSLGATMLSPGDCTVETELMPTWTHLWRQRLRWQRGALENIAAYGFTTATMRYWGQQLGIAYGTVALVSYFLLMGITLLAIDQWVWFPFWIAIGCIFAAERVLTVWREGWAARGLAVLILPELLYDLFLQAVFVRALVDILVRRRAGWGHVRHEVSS
ncbi:MAG TPA: glycosyltransferase family 2 protein [Candidatus Nanopelagicales bacterium]|nr:glycosyltransferase family 2 protein [Candidatus Nanopelagicales bacterium]